jgi:predicted Fe-Mo cluster-binding NifX family protein
MDNTINKEEKIMKIALITDDGTTISQHFGMAQMYTVLTVENGKIVHSETRAKKGHQQLGGGDHSHAHAAGQPHGFDADSENKHATMAQPISDCQVLIAGGMGRGAYESLKRYNIEPIITDKKNIDEAAKLYIENKLPNLMEKLH